MNIKIEIKLVLLFGLFVYILYNNFISIELKLALLGGFIGLIIEFLVLLNGLKKKDNLDCSLWSTIISRDIYNENKNYYDLFRFAFRDFYITVVLLLYISFMITKFLGIHISDNQNISNYYKEDIFIIIILLLISGFFI